jgi:hypothetical protein
MVYRGVILELNYVTDTVLEVAIRVKKDEYYSVIAFTAYKEIRILIQQVKIEKGDYVKIDAHLKSKKWQNKYYLSAVIDKISIVAKKSPQLIIDMETGEIIE